MASHFGEGTLWAPARCEIRGVTAVVVGRTALEPAEWDAAADLPFEGGLAARHVLRDWFAGGAEAVERFNGAAAILIVEEQPLRVHVWTDRAGVMPLYTWRDRDGVVVGSTPDSIASVAASLGRTLPLDQVTVAEFVMTGRATHPFSYWEGIEQLDPGARHGWLPEAADQLLFSGTYWSPLDPTEGPLSSRNEIVAELADSLQRAIERRTHSRFGECALMLSAGADSRAILFGADDVSRLRCWTLLDEENAEVRGASRLATIAGAEHELLQRGAGFYIDEAATTVSVTGGMWSTESGHWAGFVETIMASAPGALLTGCYADYLFKGLALDRRHRRLLGRNLPLYRLDEPRPRSSFYLPWFRLDEEWDQRVRERMEADLGKRRDSNERRALEAARLFPLSREGDAAGRNFLRRTTPFDPIMADRDVLHTFSRIGPDHRVNGIAFGMAVDRICGPTARSVLNNNHSTPVGATASRRVGVFLLHSLKRKLVKRMERSKNTAATGVASAGSWPDMGRVIAIHPGIGEWISARSSGERSFFERLLADKDIEWSRDWFARHPFLFHRILTLCHWADQQKVDLR